MAHLSKIFTKTPVDMPNKSGFDMSHENLFTATCGTLTPCLVEELLPNDEISLGEMCQVQLPPMATDFYGRVDACIEAFFVPYRILWGGWQDFITNPTTNPFAPDTNPPKTLPTLSAPSTSVATAFGRGSLADYLGLKGVGTSADSGSFVIPNLLPFLAYHKIYEDWYMNTEIQKTPFLKAPNGTNPMMSAPWVRNSFSANVSSTGGGTGSAFNDGVQVHQLRQRLWAKDYFTTANLYPQAGGASQLSFDVADSKGSFTIASLRAANVLQRWLERNNIAGYRYADQIKAQFGCLPSDAVMDRSIFLGRAVHSVYTKSVYNTAGSPTDSATGNPFGGSASKFGTSQAVGEGSLIKKFRATEHGFIFCLFSLVPHAYYSTGTRRLLMRSKVGDFAFPLLQGVGEQSIYIQELQPAEPLGTLDFSHGNVFGYTDQYAEYKYHDDECHGLLVDGESLSAFALQRSFSESSVQLGTSFLEIPKDFLDQVTAVNGAVSKFGCWVDMYLSMKKVSTLSAYQIPTLGDIKNTHKEYIDKGGRRL